MSNPEPVTPPLVSRQSPPPRRRRGLLLLGVVLPLIVALILLEMKNTRLAEKNQKLAEQNKQLKEKSEAKESTDTAALKAQLSVLRRKVGLLEIEDASKPYAVSLEGETGAKYRWRIFVPTEGKFVLACMLGAERKELPCKPGEQVVVLNLTKRAADDPHPMLFFGAENALTGLSANASESAEKVSFELYSSQTAPESNAKGLLLFKGKIDAEGPTPRSTTLSLALERADK